MRARRRPSRIRHVMRFTSSGQTAHVIDDGESAMQRFTWVPRRVLPGTTVAALCLAFAGVGRADTRVYQGLLRSTGLVEVPDRQGSGAYGTCWGVDRRRGLAGTTPAGMGDSTEPRGYLPGRR